MKKRISIALLLTALLLSITHSAFALTLNISFSDGYLSIFDKMTLAAIALFVLGMLFILLALFAGGKGKTTPAAVQAPAESIKSAANIPLPEETPSNIIEIHEETTPAEETVSSVNEPAPQEQTENTETNRPMQQTIVEDAPSSGSTKSDMISEDKSEMVSAENVSAEQNEIPQNTCDVTLTGINTKDVFTFSLVPDGSYCVGRKKDNDICLPDTIVSGRHCTFLFEEDVLYLRDEHSTNGTKVNGQKIFGRHPLHTGDVISIGRREYRIGI